MTTFMVNVFMSIFPEYSAILHGYGHSCYTDTRQCSRRCFLCLQQISLKPEHLVHQ